jgi:hypothetical protein
MVSAKGNRVSEAELLDFENSRDVTVAGGTGIGLVQDVNGIVGRKDVALQIGEGDDADHLIGAHVVGLTSEAVLQQG